MAELDEVLSTLLGTAPVPAPPADSIAAWWARHCAHTAAVRAPIDRALRGGFTADRVAYAFAAGYQEALRALVPGLPAGTIASLCATEAQAGAHPRSIATRLEPAGEGAFTLHGAKRWSTLAPDGSVLLVLASEGTDAQGRNKLRLARVAVPRAGVRVVPMPPTPFAPEVLHAAVEFEGARVALDELLAGDGYEAYVKPFRTVEDCHVYGALMAYVLRVGRAAGWPTGALEAIAGAIAAVRGLALCDPRAPAVHVALAGALDAGRRALDAAEPHWAAVDDATRAAWERDRALLSIAEKARAQRTVRAWELLRGGATAAR